MKKLNLVFCLAVAVVCFGVVSCKDTCSGDPDPDPEQVDPNDVYIVGSKFIVSDLVTVPVVWKNGDMTVLGTSYGEGRAVCVVGDDVYVAGYEYVDGNSTAVLWINGVANFLPGGDYSEARCVCVDGDDVYVGGSWIEMRNSGWEYNNAVGAWHSAVVWKNGVPMKLCENGFPGGDAFVSCVGVHDGRLYAAGVIGAGVEVCSARLWRDGNEVWKRYGEGDGGFDFCAVTISNGKLFTAVQWFDSNHNQRFSVWRQNMASVMEIDNSCSHKYAPADYIRGMVVHDEDIYAAGTLLHRAVVWKNGEPIVLVGADTASSVFVTPDGDVYVTAWYGDLYWKNGTPVVVMGDDSGWWSMSQKSIFVVPKN